jgi:hypothetical protein
MLNHGFHIFKIPFLNHSKFLSTGFFIKLKAALLHCERFHGAGIKEEISCRSIDKNGDIY